MIRFSAPAEGGDYLFLLLKTPMKIYLQEELIITKENACLLFTPQTPQHYQAVKRFCNSYLHFSSDLSPARQYGFPENEIFYPSNPAEIDSFIRSVQMEYFSLAEYRDEYIHCLISQMFISISQGSSPPRRPEGGWQKTSIFFSRIFA